MGEVGSRVEGVGMGESHVGWDYSTDLTADLWD